MTVTVAIASHQSSAISPQPTTHNSQPTTVFQLLIALLALQSLWMTLFLRVSPTGMPSYVPYQPGNPAIAIPADVTFQNDIRLVGYDVAPTTIRAARESPLSVTLYWQAATRPDLPSTIFVHLTDRNGTLIAQHDSMPAGSTRPTSCWLPGEVVEDFHTIVIPSDAQPGDYTIRVGLYYLPTLERLPIIDGGEGDIFHLPHTITVIPN